MICVTSGRAWTRKTESGTESPWPTCANWPRSCEPRGWEPRRLGCKCSDTVSFRRSSPRRWYRRSLRYAHSLCGLRRQLCTLASLLAVGLCAAFAAQDAGFRSGRESAAAGCIGCPAAHRHAVQTEEQGRGDYYTCVHPGRRGTVAQHPSQLAPALARSSRAVLLSVDKSNGR